MTRRRLTFGIAGGLLLLDIVTKAVVSHRMFVGESRWLIDGWAALTYVRNTGVAFGMFPGKRWSFIALSVVGIAAVLTYVLRHPPRLKREAWALGLFLGGAFGNLIDRVRWGEVIDFIELGPPPHTFAVFNVADMGVTFGVVLLLWAALLPHAAETTSPGGPDETAPDHALPAVGAVAGADAAGALAPPHAVPHAPDADEPAGSGAPPDSTSAPDAADSADA